MEIEKRYQKLGLSGDPAIDYDDIDFDVVPPLEQVINFSPNSMKQIVVTGKI